MASIEASNSSRSMGSASSVSIITMFFPSTAYAPCTMSVAFSRSSSSKSFSLPTAGISMTWIRMMTSGSVRTIRRFSSPFWASRTSHVLGAEDWKERVSLTRKLSILSRGLIRASSTEEYLTRVVDGEDGLALRAAEPPRLGGFQFLAADGTFENAGERGALSFLPARGEERDRLVEIFLDIEELGESEELEDLVDLRLDLQQYKVASAWFDGLEEGGEGANARTGDIVQAAAVEDQLDEGGLDGLGNALLEVVGIIRVDVAGEIKHEAPVRVLDLLEAYFEAVVLFVVEPWNNLVVTHGAPLPAIIPFGPL